MVRPLDSFRYEVYHDLIQLAPILAVCFTVILTPVLVVALIQWRKVAVAKQMRKLVGDLAKRGYKAKDIGRITKSVRLLQTPLDDEFCWDISELEDHDGL